jgi:hypothetical protein
VILVFSCEGECLNSNKDYVIGPIRRREIKAAILICDGSSSNLRYMM